jgi:hypothetical protein
LNQGSEMSELIINVELHDEDDYREALNAVKELAHVFIDMEDFKNAGACVIQLIQLQRQHDQAPQLNPPQEA